MMCKCFNVADDSNTYNTYFEMKISSRKPVADRDRLKKKR